MPSVTVVCKFNIYDLSLKFIYSGIYLHFLKPYYNYNGMYRLLPLMKHFTSIRSLNISMKSCQCYHNRHKWKQFLINIVFVCYGMSFI